MRSHHALKRHHEALPAPAAANDAPLRIPRIRLPVIGSGRLQVELIGVGVSLGSPLVTGDVRPQKQTHSDVFLLEGRLYIERSADSLWVHVGTAAFRTDPLQELCVQDFMQEVEQYAAAHARPPVKL